MDRRSSWIGSALLSVACLAGAAWVAGHTRIVSDTRCGPVVRPNNLHAEVCGAFYRRNITVSVVLVLAAVAWAVAAVVWRRRFDSAEPAPD